MLHDLVVDVDRVAISLHIAVILSQAGECFQEQVKTVLLLALQLPLANQALLSTLCSVTVGKLCKTEQLLAVALDHILPLFRSTEVPKKRVAAEVLSSTHLNIPYLHFRYCKRVRYLTASFQVQSFGICYGCNKRSE